MVSFSFSSKLYSPTYSLQKIQISNKNADRLLKWVLNWKNIGLIFGCQLSVVGCQLLVVGCWLLVVSYLLSVIYFSLPFSNPKMFQEDMGPHGHYPLFLGWGLADKL